MTIEHIPPGYSEVHYRGRRYGLSRIDRAAGRAVHVYAKELGGRDYISFNYYYTDRGGQLRPCEMPVDKVLDFLAGAVPVSEK